ncbi:transposase family protein [Rhodococcus triatomae]|nr:transposase family protein [Rhodococcus triatomae]QNG19945.1 transposase family protein [Rhodococcus triatomae]QNG24140.1 transposase family protein [Rhodococcus triatomae]
MSSSPIPSVTVDTTLTIGASSHPSGLLDILTAVPDPRKRRGVRHTISTVLAIALAATIAGARSFTAIGEWIADVPTTEYARLGIDGTVPSESTIRRCLQRLEPDQLDALIGSWMWLHTNTTDGRG